jgi:hypothetical protein
VEDPLERVQYIAPAIREHADRDERQRHSRIRIVEALEGRRSESHLVPRELGGLQVDPLTFYQVVKAPALFDGSTRCKVRGDSGRGGCAATGAR